MAIALHYPHCIVLKHCEVEFANLGKFKRPRFRSVEGDNLDHA